jgi:hypothetical protein
MTEHTPSTGPGQDVRDMRDAGVQGQTDGPEAGASDNAAENAAPDVAGDVLGAGARDGVTDADRGLGTASDEDGTLSGAPGDDLSQPRTGAETPVEAEDLVHARGQDVTPATLRQAQERLDAEGPAAVEAALPDQQPDL